MGLSDMSRHFLPPRQRNNRGRWTWRQNRRGRVVSSQPDYFMAGESNRRDFRGVALKSPRHHDSNHRAAVATIYAGSRRQLTGYTRKRCRFPVCPPKKGPRTHAEQIFEELKATCEPTPSRERVENSWIQPDTWRLIDARAALRKEGKLAQRALRTHNRRVTAALKHDRKKHAADVGGAMMEKLAGGEMQEAWRMLKGWYRYCKNKSSQIAR